MHRGHHLRSIAAGRGQRTLGGMAKWHDRQGGRAAVAADPEIKPTDDEFWKAAGVVMSKRKGSVTMRLDTDVLAWFRGKRGCQTRTNTIFRAHMNAHQSR